MAFRDLGPLMAVMFSALLAACSGEGQSETTGGDAASANDVAQADSAEKQASRVSSANAAKDWNRAISDLEHREGFLTLYLDHDAGRVYAAFPAPDEDGVSLKAIYATGLTAGLGSNPIGLDRGLFDSGSIYAFRRMGDKIIAEQENWTYRASAENPLEKRAVRESFARSFQWSGKIRAEHPDGTMLVDMTSFINRDSLNVVHTLGDHPGGGTFSIAADRTLPDMENIFAFPDNVEFDGFLTLTSAAPKSQVRATAADGRSITLVQHHSLIRLPDDNYVPRDFDVRSGAIDVPYYDFSKPLKDQIIGAFARRFRLQRAVPGDSESAIVKPLIFYVDSGAPAEIRDALIEGALWWSDAFAAAGFPDAYRVEILPEDAHPRDSRFNTILWTHRQTRGWSYGGGISDPRTGEMIKANVILGSQRVRQDRMIFEGLAGVEASGTGGANDPVEIALDRIRQLSAHEVGHTLGFAHNFAASSNDRASVMDYPAPFVTIGDDGKLDFSAAYDQGIGEWDKVAAAWLYSEFAEGTDEPAALEAILSDAYASGLRFVADRHGRSVGTAHPYASVWDNGGDPVEALRGVINVRSVALSRFSENVIQPGQPIAQLRNVIVPIYLYHRYQTAAAAKMIGGYDFAYNLRGDDLSQAGLVDDVDQRGALTAILSTLEPEFLDLPDDLVTRLSPLPGQSGEAFESKTGPVFDLLAAADASGSLSLQALLHPDRLARLVDYRSRDENRLGMDELLRDIETTIFVGQPEPRAELIAQRLQSRFVFMLIGLSGGLGAEGEQQAAALGLAGGGGAIATPEVRATIESYLKGLRSRIAPGLLDGPSTNRSHRDWLATRIGNHLERPANIGSIFAPVSDIPPGSPIGSGMLESCWHCDPIPGISPRAGRNWNGE